MRWCNPVSIAVLTFTAGAALAASPAKAAAPAAETQPVSASVTDQANIETLDLERERNGRLTVEVFIGGAGPFDFMIDTGAQATVLTSELADRLELHNRSTALLIGMASSKMAEVVSVPDFALGSRVFDLEVAPLVSKEHMGGAEGILGIDSLQDQRVLFDFRKKKLSVADAKTLGGNRGYEIVVKARRRLGQLVITQAELDGMRVAVIIDTGAQGSVGNPALQRRMRSKELGIVQMTDVHGEQLEGRLQMAKKVQIGKVRLTNVPIAFAKSPIFAALGLEDEPAIVLGMSALRLFRRVAIDFKERKILFDLPRGTGWARNTMGSTYSF